MKSRVQIEAMSITKEDLMKLVKGIDKNIEMKQGDDEKHE
jgi:hypothetical protein